MSLNITGDQRRFREKIKQLRREGLEKYFSQETITLPQLGGKTISIPIENLELPRFIFGNDDENGVGQGQGEEGDVIPGEYILDGQKRGHGSGRGNHSVAELTLEEAAEILAEELELPNLLEKYGGEVSRTYANKYSALQPAGPKSLRHKKKTFMRALKRSIVSEQYDPNDPQIIFQPRDERFRASLPQPKPVTKAAMIWLLDYSGSMNNVLDFLQNVGWWANAWIKKHYELVDNRYIQYDSFAKEVSADEFYSVDAGGGTSMSAGLSLAKKIILQDYPDYSYNVYLIQFTDGDCRGLEVSPEELEWHQQMARQYPEIYSLEEMPGTGNSLTDFLIPRSSAIFVCEAGAYYEHSFSWKGKSVNGNYSSFLERLIEARPVLEQKVRFVSYTEEEVREAPGQRVKETLLNWFK